MKKYLYFLLLVAIIGLQACSGPAQAPVQEGISGLIPAVQSDQPYDPTLLGSAVNKPASGSSSCAGSTANAASFATEVIRLVNVQRANAGLGALTSQSQLTQAAQTHASDMGCRFFMSHTGSDGSTPDVRIARAGYVYSWWGENVASGFSTPADVMTAWMNSPSHRDNILNPNFTQIGIGYMYNSADTTNYYHYWCMTLGRPQ
jgi:uncharacterized protein YkwD